MFQHSTDNPKVPPQRPYTVLCMSQPLYVNLEKLVNDHPMLTRAEEHSCSLSSLTQQESPQGEWGPTGAKWNFQHEA